MLAMTQLAGFGGRRPAVKTSTGFTLGGTAANNADAGDVAWTNASNVLTASDGTYATDGGLFNNSTQYLHVTNFGFAIPTSAIILGVTARLRKFGGNSSNPNIVDHTIQLISGGSRSGSNKADTTTKWQLNSPKTVDYGGATDLWGLMLTPTIINASNFGIAVRAQDPTFGSDTPRVCYVQLDIAYQN
jgi:hypothetical protein